MFSKFNNDYHRITVIEKNKQTNEIDEREEENK